MDGSQRTAALQTEAARSLEGEAPSGGRGSRITPIQIPSPLPSLISLSSL